MIVKVNGEDRDVSEGTTVAGLIARRDVAAGKPVRGPEALLVVALTIANPTLWATALSLLIAIVPLWRSTPLRAPQPAMGT